MFAVLGTAALELSLGFDSVQLAALVAVPTIVLGFFSVVAPAVRLIAQRMEFEADRFGATFVGVTCAIDALRELKGIVPQWNRTAISSDIEDRIAALTRYEATSTGRLNRY
jgi:Zn-dependent protease with chaperone function